MCVAYKGRIGYIQTLIFPTNILKWYFFFLFNQRISVIKFGKDLYQEILHSKIENCAQDARSVIVNKQAE